jgi:flagellar basal body-associated protein FliL
MEKRKIIIIISIVLCIILLTAYIWFLVSTYKKVYPSATDKNEKTTIRQERELGPIEITPEMLESITPPSHKNK